MDLFDNDQDARIAQSEERVDLRRQIEARRSEADAAHAKYNDIEWLHACLDGLDIVLDRIHHYNPAEDRPEAGIMLLGEIKCSLMSIFGQLQPIQEIQELQERLAQLTERDPTDSSPDDVEA